MNNNRHRDYYISSMSVAGVRGTLKDLTTNKHIKGKFIGKSEK